MQLLGIYLIFGAAVLFLVLGLYGAAPLSLIRRSLGLAGAAPAGRSHRQAQAPGLRVVGGGSRPDAKEQAAANVPARSFGMRSDPAITTLFAEVEALHAEVAALRSDLNEVVEREARRPAPKRRPAAELPPELRRHLADARHSRLQRSG
jgi:hypothetical protein